RGTADAPPAAGRQGPRQLVPLGRPRVPPRRRRAERVPAPRRSARRGDTALRSCPRRRYRVDEAKARPSTERISLGTPEMDELFGGSVWAGTSTLVIGPPGVGKTMLGLDFVAAGARAGHRAVFATLQESVSQLTRVIQAGAWSGLRDHLEIHRLSPVDMYIDEWVKALLATVERTGADLLVVDSLSDLRLASPDETRFEEDVYSLRQRWQRDGTHAL